MDIKQIRAMSAEELNAELLELRKAQFKLRIQQAVSQQSKPHELARMRKTIAKIKTILTEKAGKSS